MPIGYGGTPRTMPPHATQFPLPGSVGEREMLAQRLLSQQQGFSFPRGLLDQSVPQRFGPPPGGLLQPVILDRVRRGLLQTEGAPRGGGGGGRTTSVPQAGRRPPFVDWSYSENSGTFTTTTPKGQWMLMRPTHARGYEVMFDRTGPRATEGKGTTSSGIERFSDVIKATHDFVKKFKPQEIEFTGDSKKHNMLYEKLAPRLADMLGGKLVQPHKNRWVIKLEAK